MRSSVSPGPSPDFSSSPALSSRFGWLAGLHRIQFWQVVCLMFGLAVGADDYLVKLVDIYEVVAAVERAVHIGSAERQQRMQALLDQPEAVGDDWPNPPSQAGALAEQDR